MKIIKVPESINSIVSNRRTGQKDPFNFSFIEFLVESMNQFPQFGKGFANIEKGMKIKSKLNDLGDKKELALEDDHYNCLKDAVEASQWNPEVAHLFVPFYKALNEASNIEK